MNGVIAIPIYLPSDEKAAKFFLQNQIEIDNISAGTVIVIWPRSVKDGDSADVSKAIDSSRFPGLNASDLPCLSVEHADKRFYLPLPGNVAAINKELRRLIDQTRKAQNFKELERQMKKASETPRGNNSSPPHTNVPPWFPIAGYAAGAVTLLFLMALVLVDKNIESPAARFALVTVVALGCALSFTFIGGSAAAHGGIPLPFARSRPIQFSVGGGIAVFVIVWLLGYNLFIAGSEVSPKKKGSTQESPPALVAPGAAASPTTPASATPPSSREQQVQQETKGNVSPAISGVQGNVSVTSGGGTPALPEEPAAAAKQPSPAQTTVVKQQTSGAVSPAISDVKGNVSVHSSDNPPK
jgi:hypothetical protein